MSRQEYAFEEGGPKRLEISWGRFWESITISLDGREIGRMSKLKVFFRGGEFSLPDGSTLNVKFVDRPPVQGLQVLKDGEPVPGSAGSIADFETNFKHAYSIVFFVAAINFLIGILGSIFLGDLFLESGRGIGAMIYGVIFIGLGLWARRKSSLALIVAIIVFTINILEGMNLLERIGYNSTYIFAFGLSFFLYFTSVGIRSLGQLKKHEKDNYV